MSRPDRRRRPAVRPTTRWAAIVLAACTVTAWAMPVASAEDVPWTAVSAAGSVESRPAYEAEDHWSRLRAGDLVAPWSAVRTGKRSHATLAAGAATVRLGSGAWVEIPGIDDVDRAMPPTAMQDDGTVTYEFRERSGIPIEVLTPFLVARSGEGVFVVDVDLSTERVNVRAVDGSVVVTSRMDGTTAELSGGESAALDLAIGPGLDVRRPGSRVARSVPVSATPGDRRSALSERRAAGIDRSAPRR